MNEKTTATLFYCNVPETRVLAHDPDSGWPPDPTRSAHEEAE